MELLSTKVHKTLNIVLHARACGHMHAHTHTLNVQQWEINSIIIN